MKTLFAALFTLLSLSAFAAGTSQSPPKATDSQIDAGTDDRAYITSKGLQRKALSQTNVSQLTVSNQWKSLGLNLTNKANVIGLANSNLSYQVGAANTNLANNIGQNNTNLANAIGLTLSNRTDTNSFRFQYQVPGWEDEMERLPIDGQVAPIGLWVTNFVEFHRNYPDNPEYNTMWAWEDIYLTNRVGGHLAFNTVNFPQWADQNEYREYLHANGWRMFLWYDRANSTSEGYASDAQTLDDVQTLFRWEPDGIWLADKTTAAYYALMVARTNAKPVQLMFNILPAQNPPIDDERRLHRLGTHWRFVNTPAVDITTWPIFIQAVEQFESNAWWMVGPGHAPYFGPEIFHQNSTSLNQWYSRVVWSSVQSGCNILSWCSNSVFQTGPDDLARNPYLRAIRRDPAVQPARRVFETNGCWMFLKPLGTPGGPNFAVYVLNTNTIGSTNYSFTFAQLNQGRQSSSAKLSGRYDITWTLTNTLAVPGADSFSGTLGSNYFALLTLKPEAAQATNPAPMMHGLSELNRGVLANYNFNAGTGTVVSNTVSTNWPGNYGAAGYTWTNNGIADYAAHFHGDGHMTGFPISECPPVVSFLQSNISLSAWIRSSSNDGVRCIVGKWGGAPSVQSFELATAFGTNFIFYTMNDALTEDQLAPTTDSKFTNSAWHHVAATWDGVTKRLYFDGALIGSKAHSGRLNTNATPLQVGASGIHYWFSGDIDEVTYWNRTLNSNDVRRLYKFTGGF